MNILRINEEFILFFMIANKINSMKKYFQTVFKYLKLFQKQLLFVNNEK